MEEGSDFLQIMLQSSFCTVSSSVKFCGSSYWNWKFKFKSLSNFRIGCFR